MSGTKNHKPKAPRPYRMGLRAEKSEKNRERVLHAARLTILRDGYHGISLETVAKRAKLTRLTLYNLFGSKLGLLEALLDDLAIRGEIRRFAKASQDLDCSRAMEEMVRALFAFWGTDPDLFRRLLGLGDIDPEAARKIADREERRSATWHRLAARLAEEGRVRSGFTQEEVAAILSWSTSFESYQALGGISSPEKAQDLWRRLMAGVLSVPRSEA